MLFNIPWKNQIYFLAVLALSVMIMILTITQMNNIQIIGLEIVYANLDKKLLFFRASLLFVISVFGIATFYRYPNSIPGTKYFWRNLSAVTIILLAGLSAFYIFSCCDSPVVFYMGLPFSWLRGISPESHYLPTSPISYLTTNVTMIDWYIDIFSLILSFLFWNNVLILWNAFFTKRTLHQANNHISTSA
jgi:hypothetical protein